MKTILVSLNSKFIHTNLAIRYLAKYVADIEDIPLYEYTINQNPDFIASEIYKLHPDVVGFSTYIWNLNEVLKVCQILKLVKPEIKILLGGPEVSYDGDEMMGEIPYIDYIIYGEGEETFKEFVTNIKNQELNNFKGIKGLIFRDGDKIIKNQERPLIANLDKLPFPYEEDLEQFTNQIIYYEASRGCPFDCQYCLSSTLRGVRMFDIERVKRDLDVFIEGKVKQVKFVDRTFNANKKYSMGIIQYIKERDPENINFHFEITAHLIDDDFLNLIKDAREGLFQFEIGVQSTNNQTIDAIGRTTDFQLLSDVVNKIKSFKNIHQHLDLIAGLPYEDYNVFKDSFNDVYDLKPEKLQLGFLKLLKGSGLRLAEDKYGYKYTDEPPYEVLESKFISYEKLLKLKEVEDMVERYYNEGHFEHTLNYIVGKHFKTAFDFYEDISEYWYLKNYHQISHSKQRNYQILIEYMEYKEFDDLLFMTQLLKLDFTINNKNTRLQLPYKENNEYRSRLNLHDLLRNEKILNQYLSKYKEMPIKKLINNIVVERFEFDVLGLIDSDFNMEKVSKEVFILFEYRDGIMSRANAYDITEIVGEMI